MTNFYLWRGCDISGLGVREALLRNRDFVDRAVSIIGPEGYPGSETGVPADPVTPGDAGTSPCSQLDVVSAQWINIQNTGAGVLEPGTYSYSLVPVDTCTGRTCSPITLPDLVITELGQVATLAITFGTDPGPCDGYLIQRGGRIVGPVIPAQQSFQDEVNVTVPAVVEGTFSNFDNEAQSFEFSGADLEVSDFVRIDNPSTNDPSFITITGKTGSTVTFSPKIAPRTDARDDAWFDMKQRFAPYVQELIPGGSIPLVLPAVPPFRVTIPLPLNLIGGGFQLLDIVTYGGGTGIIVGTGISSGLGPTYDILPFGITVPMPMGLMWLVHRTINTSILPTLNDGLGLFSDVSMDGDQYTALFPANPSDTTQPLDPNLKVGRVLVVSSASVISNATIAEIRPVDAANVMVVFQPGLATGQAPNTPFADFGLYFILPELVSSFMNNSGVVTAGTYERLTRRTDVITLPNTSLTQEDGSEVLRSGDTGSLGREAFSTFKGIVDRSGFAGGFDALRRKVTGPCKEGAISEASLSFNRTLGSFVRPRKSNRFFAVNDVASYGTGPFVNATSLRGLRSAYQTSFSSYRGIADEAINNRVAVARYREVTVTVPAAGCPPGQTTLTQTNLIFVGLATKTAPVKQIEKAMVLWAPSARFDTGARLRVQQLGLNQSEADDAISLVASGRVVTVRELSVEDVNDVVGSTDPGFDDILDDDRIKVVDTGPVTSPVIDEAIRRRGVGAIARRPFCTNPDEKVLVNDCETVATNILALALQYPESFNLCDVDEALAAIPDAKTRAAVAAVFAVADGSFDQLATFGQVLEASLKQQDFVAAKETIAGIVNAISADPSLSCLVGPALATVSADVDVGLPSLPVLEQTLSSLSIPLSVRLNLLELANSAVRSVVCALLGEMSKLVPSNLSNAASYAIGCLPTIPQLQGYLGTNINLEVTLSCYYERLDLLLNIMNSVRAELTELIDFVSSLGGLLRIAQSSNLSCSSDENLSSLFNRAMDELYAAQQLGANAVNQTSVFFGV